MFAGLDVGSRTTKLVLFDGALRDSKVVPTGVNPLERCREFLAGNSFKRLVVTGEMANDQMELLVEVPAGDRGDTLTAGLENAIRDVTKLRGQVRFVDPASLPNDGKVIEDARTYR
jgi:hypothetical protein